MTYMNRALPHLIIGDGETESNVVECRATVALGLFTPTGPLTGVVGLEVSLDAVTWYAHPDHDDLIEGEVAVLHPVVWRYMRLTSDMAEGAEREIEVGVLEQAT
jgi:hypothetical protein